MGSQHRIVRLDNTRGNFGRRINFVSNLRFFTIINGNAFEDESTKTRPGPATYSMVNYKPLDILRIVYQLSQAVVYLIQDLFSNSVVAPGKVVCSIFLTVQQKLRVKHLGVISSTHIINNSWLQINSNVSWNILSSSSLFVEGGEVLVSIFIGQGPILIDLVLCTVLPPHSISQLNPGLSNIDG